MRTPLIAGNWKMHMTIAEADKFVDQFVPLVQGVKNIDILICPPYTGLAYIKNKLKSSEIKLGAQNVFWEEKGAFTGEISPLMLADAGCSHVIIGHSERRHIMQETDEMINRKLKSVLKAGLTPILCVGETLAERQQNTARKVVERQLAEGLRELSIQPDGLVIAYEPVWAIGTGVTAGADDAQEMTGFIRGFLGKLYSASLADSIRILYGGSVKPDNIAGFMAREDVDGALVGGASLDAQTFARIVRF